MWPPYHSGLTNPCLQSQLVVGYILPSVAIAEPGLAAEKSRAGEGKGTTLVVATAAAAVSAVGTCVALDATA